MIAVKEISGKIYIAQVAPATGDENKKTPVPGKIDNWYFIGPGEKPFVSWSGGDTYIITFNYLSHVFSRLISLSQWPPNQVDPVTYTPQISIQKPELWVPLSNRHDPNAAQLGRPGDVGYIKRDGLLLYDLDTGIYSASFSRDSTYSQPGIGTRKGYRFYTRPVGSSTWTMVQDWSQDIQNVWVQNSGSLVFEAAISWGNFWADGKQNLPNSDQSGWYEFPPGPSAFVNSNTEARALVKGIQEVVQVPLGSEDSVASTMTTNSKFWYCAYSENISLDTHVLGSQDTKMDSNSKFVSISRSEIASVAAIGSFDCAAVALF